MTKPPRHTWALALLAALHGGAEALTPEERPYLGGYTSGSVDTVSQIMLLDDNTFCFRFMGGALDMLVAGHWKALPGKNAGVRLQEVRKAQTLFPAFAKAGSGYELVFDFHGYTLGEALAPVFATSPTAAWPRILRPLFDDKRQSWAESYPLPAMPSAAARYFYIGQMEMDARGQPQQLRVTQYQLPAALQGGTVRIGFDTQQARPPLNLVAQLKGERLQVDGQSFGRRDVLAPELVAEIRAACVAPVLTPGKARPAVDPDTDEAPREHTPPLVPLGSKVLPLSSVQGEPIFPTPAN